MRNPTGEMPFLDHLEELRKRILLSAAGIFAGLCVGWWITNRFDMIHRLEAPIAPFIPGGKLMVTTPISPFMIVLKFALVFGMILSSPWVLYQLWLFLSPALTAKEKKAILPALGVGLLLFLAGAAVGWFLVLEPTVRWLLLYHNGDFLTQITYDSYLELVVHLLVAMGISAELPLIMILLSSLGIVSYRRYASWRRYSLFLCFIGGAILSPAPEVVSMILFTIPLVVLYEVGVGGAYLVERRRLRRPASVAGALLLALALLTPRGLHAQNPPIPGAQGPPSATDTTPRNVRGLGVHAIDSSAAKRLGIPAGPTRKFPAPDSIMQALLDREDFAATRYLADSALFGVDSQQVVLSGHAATDRDNSQLEADRIVDNDAQCQVEAQGEPRMFQPNHPALIGVTMQFNTCSERGTIGTALTSVPMEGSNWFVRGNLEEQAGGKIVYAAKTSFTSCDLPEPHYHFVAKEVKWETGAGAMIVARPAVLYIRDVPVAWLPFIFQNTATGRSSGILIPHFGFNDIVRPTPSYNRAFTNLGYYWAPNDYFDASAHFDWFSDRYVNYSGTAEYHWLNRFVEGNITVGDQIEGDGSSNKSISWQHNQSFNTTTKVALVFNYSSNSQVMANNAIDPIVSTQGINSQLSLDKQFVWGALSLGGSRDQSVGPGQTTTVFPKLTLTPRSIAFGKHVTWSPTFSLTSTDNSTSLGTPTPELLESGVDTLSLTNKSRDTDILLGTPIELYGFQLTNSIEYRDQNYVGLKQITTRVPDPTTANPNDSINVTTYRSGDYETGVTMTPTISLPLLFRGTWKVTPSVGITNVVSAAPLLLRTPGSDGAWVAQGFKTQVTLQSAPSLFGFINRGLGGYTRFRYTLSPILTLTWSPAATVSPAFARALSSLGGVQATEVPASMVGSVTLHQTFEGKTRPAPTDTNTDPIHLASLPKRQLLTLSTGMMGYDFEQAKLPGRTGWTTQSISNTFQSDLIQGFTLQTTHDLWQGDVGSDTARFAPFLSDVQANFRITGGTFTAIERLLGLAHRDTATAGARPGAAAGGLTGPLASAASAMAPLRSPSGLPAALPHTGFSATIGYNLTRARPGEFSLPPPSTEPPVPGMTPDVFNTNPLIPIPTAPLTNQLQLGLAFSPTPFWTVSWNTQYDFNAHAFQSQQIQLQRDLHDWRASFNFTKNPNGNFALYFTIYLLTMPDIKFDYQQTTLQEPGTTQP